MDDVYKQAFKYLIQHEGGFVNHPNDPGGATKYGVSLRFLKQAGYDIDGDGDIDIDDIHALDLENASEIYHKEFWIKAQCENLSKSIAVKHFDTSVNVGIKQAGKILQNALNATKGTPKLVVDGMIGYKTLNRSKEIPVTQVMGAYCDAQRRFYMSLIANKPELKVFAKGWLNRAAWTPRF